MCIVGIRKAKHVSCLCECWSLETVGYVFLEECRKYRAERNIFFVQLAGLVVKVFSLLSLFGHSDEHKLISKAVLRFLHDTGLYVRI